MNSVLGPHSAIEGRRPSWGRSASLEAVVLSGTRLDHYRRLGDRPDRPWVRVGAVTEHATGSGALTFANGKLLVQVPEPGGLATYRLTASGWSPQTDVAIRHPDRSDRPDTPSAADLGAELRQLRAVATFTASGWPQALTDEDGSVFSYHRTPAGRWERNSCLRLADPEPFRLDGPESEKLAQITGDLDATPTPWGKRLPTLSGSLSSAGIRGSDLGVRVEHGGRTFLLFGDTHWTRPWLNTRDSIAEVTAAGPLPGLPGVRFHGSPLKLLGRATMREYDVPLDAFSDDGALFGFFTSDHFRDRRVMGRSVLARALDPDLAVDPAARRRPVRFRVLGTFSDRHFINVSAQLVPAAQVPGCLGDGQILLAWGTGPYRASEPRLALLDQTALGLLAKLRRPAPTAELGIRYWAGRDGDRPLWSDSEGDARPLFGPAALGELSVRWVPAAGRYLLLAGSGPEDPIGPAITLRTAAWPWGPWSPRLRLLDWVATGMSHADPNTRFIRAVADDSDPVADRIFPGQANGTGAAYAPYFFDAVVDDADLVLRYTLSTWNPYQVVLMRHRLPLAEL